MSRMIALLAVASALSAPLLACASRAADTGSLPICDGKHRRSANVYGSVLTEGSREPSPTAASSSQNEQAAPAPGGCS